MGYLHIDNLYKNQEILLFKECYALEKIHGTSAHITFDGDNKLTYFSGGEKHSRFINLFDDKKLLTKFKEYFNSKVIIYGEAYGGKQQRMSETYGKELKFVAFDVLVDSSWLNVPNAYDVVMKLGLEFVDYCKISTKLEDIDQQRDRPSKQAIINQCGNDKIREGVVLRPLIELKGNNGKRIISKHKRDEFMETATKREVSPERLKILEDANDIATEWVTNQRLQHVIDKVDFELDVKNTGLIIKAMIKDVCREAKDEIIESNTVSKMIGKHTSKLFIQHLKNKLL